MILGIDNKKDLKAAAYLLTLAEKMSSAIYGMVSLLEAVPEGLDEIQVQGIAAALGGVHCGFDSEYNAHGEALYRFKAMVAKL